jgi:hypothetical protein
MPRINDINQILFPVEEHPVFVSVREKQAERRLPVPDKKAIINTSSQRVLGIVSRSYRLVTNRQALDWASLCCRTAFPETNPGEWEVKVVDAPSTGGHCFLDLVHNSTALDFSFVPAAERPDAFGPFIRVTNSYNALRALSFDIGFYRKVCKNGLIVPDSIIRFAFTHLRRDIGETIHFEVAHDKLVKAKSMFTDYLRSVRDCPVRRADFEPLMRGVLSLRPPQPLKPQTRDSDEWAALQAHLGDLCDRYAGELGENAYAVFNAVTEFASHPPANHCVHRDRHSLQRLAGSWLNAFTQQCRKPDFALSKYLDGLANAQIEENANPKQSALPTSSLPVSNPRNPSIASDLPQEQFMTESWGLRELEALPAIVWSPPWALATQLVRSWGSAHTAPSNSATM